MSKMQEYLEATTPAEKPANDLLGLQATIAKFIDSKGVSETLYAIAIGMENSSHARELDDVINFILNNR